MKTDRKRDLHYSKIESINWEKEFPEVPDCVHDAVDSATSQILTKKRSRRKHFPKKRMLLMVAVITLLSGMTVMAAAGLWQQRMEAMNREEVEEYFLSIAASNAPYFRFNRAMSEEENTLFEELTKLYENEGVFPEGVLTMLSDADDYKGKGIGYDKKSGTFFLPEKELNREQLLQIIDFFHKAAYAVANMNETTDSEKLDEMVQEEFSRESGMDTPGTTNVETTDVETTKGFLTAQLDYQPLNDAVSFSEIPLQGEEMLINIAAGKEYLYLGFKTEIKRMVLGSDMVEDFYKLKENEFVFALNSDKDNNVYLSLREYDAASDSYTNRLVKINAEGELVVEYDLNSAVYKDGKTLEDLMARMMLADEKGQLYVKGMWNKTVAVFLFDAEGNYVDKITSEEYTTHVANDMCFGEDGFLYLLGEEALLKIDVAAGEVAAAYDYVADEMIAAVDLVYPMDEQSFYILSYDGLFRYTMGEEGSERFLAPYESEILSEGLHYAPISQEEMVIVNMTDYENFKYKITYLTFTE